MIENTLHLVINKIFSKGSNQFVFVEKKKYFKTLKLTLQCLKTFYAISKLWL